MTRFRDGRVCNNLVTDAIDDHRIQSNYKCISWLQYPEGKNSTLGIASAWWNRATRRTTPMTTWPPRPRAPSTQRTWTSTREWCTREPMCAWSSSQVLVVMICTPHRGSSCARLSCHPCMQWVCLFDSELSIPSNFLFFSFSFNLLHLLMYLIHNLQGSSNTAYSAKKEMDSTDESYLHTGYEPKNYNLTETYVESLTESLTQYRNNWWIRSNTVGSDTMPVRHRLDFKQALSTLWQLKHQEDTAHQQRWQSYSSSWWNWQESWWHSSYEHHHEDGPSTDWSGKPVEKWLGYLFEVWFSKLMYCIITVQNSVTANSSLPSPTECVNTKPSIQQNPT